MTTQQSAPRQDSTYDQMIDVLKLATAAGCYDACDWIIAKWPALSSYCEVCEGMCRD